MSMGTHLRLQWNCDTCGVVEPIGDDEYPPGEGYAIGDCEPCIYCEGVAYVEAAPQPRVRRRRLIPLAVFAVSYVVGRALWLMPISGRILLQRPSVLAGRGSIFESNLDEDGNHAR